MHRAQSLGHPKRTTQIAMFVCDNYYLWSESKSYKEEKSEEGP